VSPIYVRPEREQAEHDRLIRFLQAEYSQRFDAVANPGDERVAAIKVGTATHFPDLVLNDGPRLVGVVEIETAASVNNLETMAKWVPFAKARVPFHLYVPVLGYEATMRLAQAHQVKAAEIWTYRPASEGFDLVRMFVDPSIQLKAVKASARAAAKPAPVVPAKAPAPEPPVKAAVATPAAVSKGANKAAPPKAAAKAGPPAAKASKSVAPAKAAPVKAVAKAVAKPKPKAKVEVKSKVKPKAKPVAKATKRPVPAARTAKPARSVSAKPTTKGAKKGSGAKKHR
jgi:outer membrane biosynthesis protein TonB